MQLIQNTGCADFQLMSYTVTGVPTTAYTVIGDPISIREFSQIQFIVTVTLGSLANVSYYLQFSQDKSIWYDDLMVNYTLGAVDFVRRTSMISADGSERIMIPNPGFNYIRFLCQGTSNNTGSSLTWGISRGWGNESDVVI